MARPATAAVRLLTGEREPVRLATTANIDVDAGGLLVIDGVQTAVGDRILVKDQADGTENGIRTASTGQWFRAADARTARTMQKGTTVHVAEGTANAGKTFVFNTLNPVIGDTAISIVFYFSDTAVTDAQTAATASAASATAAAGSASAASTSATNAATSATNAGNSATAASGSATAAATSATNAGNSATAAAGSASSASTSATNAGNSATAAASSASAAATSASTINLPTPVASTFLQRNASNTAYVTQTAPQVMDTISPTTTRGDIIFRNATTNARLAASTAGYLLQTNGAGTDPTWQGFAQPVGSSPSTRTWQSKASDFVSILDFGAIGDGLLASASANATALTNALATGKRVRIPYTAAGYHFGTNQITVGTGQSIEGENQVLLKSTATTSLFKLTGFDITSGIHNVSIDMTGSGASSTAIRFGTNSATPIYRVRLSRIRFANCVEAIGDEVHATNYVVDVIVEDCMAWLTRGRQIYIRRSRGFFLIRSTNVDFTADTIPVAWEGIRLEDFAGLELERVDVVGWGTGSRVYNSSIYGIVIATGQALWLTRVFTDSYLGVGIFLSSVSYVFANALEASLCNGLGILLSTVSKGVFVNTLVNGNTGVTGAAAGAQGLYLDTVTDCTFTTSLVYNMTGAGIAAVNANNRVTFTGTVTNTNGFGIAIQGTSAGVKFLGGSMNGNSTAVSNTASGSGNVIKDVAGYNPVGAAAVTTSASPYTYTAGASPETLYFSASTGISAVTQSGGTSILPAALAANVPMTVELDPGQAVVITYTGTLTAKKMVH